MRVMIYQAFTTAEYDQCKKWLTASQVEVLKGVWLTSNELQETVKKYLWSENSHEIQRVMECMKDGDDASIQNLMQTSTIFSGHVVDEEITQLMSDWEQELSHE